MKSKIDLALEKLEDDARDITVAIATLKALRKSKPAKTAPKPRLVAEAV